MDAQWFYICLTAVIAIVPEVGLFLWWASGLSTRVKALEVDKDRLYKEIDGMNMITNRLSVVEEQVRNMSHVLTEIRDELRKR